MKNTIKSLSLVVLLSISFLVNADEMGTGRCFTSACGFSTDESMLTSPSTTAVDEGDDEMGTGFVAECSWLEELFGLCSSGK